MYASDWFVTQETFNQPNRMSGISLDRALDFPVVIARS